ncbi:MAG: hypothetical protein ACM3O3_10670 [Syntrophothermus sp.]
MKLTYFLLIIILYIGEILPQHKNYGMLFSGNSNNINRSSLNLNPNKTFTASNKFTLSFDLTLFSANEYGTIFKLANKENTFVLQLKYVPYLNTDTSYLKLIINGNESYTLMSLNKKDLYRFNWFNQKIEFNLENDVIKYTGNNKVPRSLLVNMPDELEYSLIFGSVFRDIDVPFMALKDIKIFDEDDELKNYFPLNETNSNRVYDNFSVRSGIATNPVWLSTGNTRMNKIAEFYLHLPLEGIPYDKDNSTLKIPDEIYLINYNLLTNKVDTIFYENKFVHTDNVALYNKYDRTILSYYGGLGEVSILDNNKWSYVDVSKNKNNYFGHSRFILPSDTSLITIGGYGNYKVTNEILKYNKKNKKWSSIKLKGDFLPPFSYASSALDSAGKNLYIFGGEGNEKGHQELGFNYYYSLYQIDLLTFTVKKLESFTEPNEYKNITYRSCRNLILKDNALYGVVSFSETSDGKFNKAAIYKIDLKDNHFSLISNYDLTNEDNHPINFFYLIKTNEFVFITKIHNDKNKYNVYVIKYPPENFALITQKTYSNYKGTGFTLTIFASIITLLFLFSFFYIKKQRNTRKNELVKSEDVSQSEQESVSKNIIKEITVNKPNENFSSSINLFGSVNIYDKNYLNITPEFKPKILQLLLLIALSTKNEGMDSIGITSEKLSLILWPEFDEQHAKNNRNSNMARLRNLLEDVEGVEIVFERKQWMFKVDDLKRCDYLNYKYLLSALKNGKSNSDETFEEFLSIIQKGVFLKDISYEWLDIHKMNVFSDVVSISLSKAEKHFSSNNYNAALKIAEVILDWDIINETAFKLKINCLNSLGRLGEAKKSYEHFSMDYEKSFNKPYKVEFNEIITE